MIYAHIAQDENGYSAFCTYDFKYTPELALSMKGKEPVAILFEESGHLAFLDKKIAEWMFYNNVEYVAGYSDCARMQKPSRVEHIFILQSNIRRISVLLEDSKDRAIIQKAIIKSQQEDIIALEAAAQNHQCAIYDDLYEVDEKPSKKYLN